MFSAMGTEPRLRIMHVLLSAHPGRLGRRRHPGRIGHSQFHPFSPPRQAQERSPRKCSTRKHIPALHREHRSACRKLLQFLYAECCTRNKAETARRSFRSADRREPMCTESNIKDVVKEKYGQAALRVTSGGSSCCGASSSTGSPDPITSNLYGSNQTGGDSGRSPARFARLRQSYRAREIKRRRSGARPRFRWRH